MIYSFAAYVDSVGIRVKLDYLYVLARDLMFCKAFTSLKECDKSYELLFSDEK